MEHKYIIADHIRTACFVVNDGVYPAPKGRGYILRRLIRRSLRSSLALGIDISGDSGNAYFRELINQVVLSYKGVYDFEDGALERILEILSQESIKYQKAIVTGEREWQKVIKKQVDQQPSDEFLARTTWDFYQSHGVPLELSESILENAGFSLDTDLLNAMITKHQEVSNTTEKGEFKSGLMGDSAKMIAMHTLTHILHQVLIEVGNEMGAGAVRQMGSSITEEKARFDFSFSTLKNKSEELVVENDMDLLKLEGRVNKIIGLGLKMSMQEMTPEEAKASGAIGLFGEKYGAKVTVYTLEDEDGKVYSREFCTGPHVNNTSTIKAIKILKLKSLGSGVKRIEFDVIL